MALAIWAACAFVTWNVIFDRHVYLASVAFTESQIEQHQRGEPVSSIDAAFTPHVREAAITASVWGVSVLLVGVAVTAFATKP